jgi:hypothetical protein
VTPHPLNDAGPNDLHLVELAVDAVGFQEELVEGDPVLRNRR